MYTAQVDRWQNTPDGDAHNPALADPITNFPKVVASGRCLLAKDEKYYIRGATYGPFGAEGSSQEYGDPNRVNRDFARMAAAGINAIRTYTVPPRWLLDAAQNNRLRVMVGLAWEQHVAFLDDPGLVRAIQRKVASNVRACGDHPAICCYAIGNEIPASVVRWHGARKVEDFLRKLFLEAKSVQPETLFTYVNYPTTEYLELPFLDLVAFNVYLKSRDKLAGYIPRLQNLSGERPLVIAELGLDSRRNGEDNQALSLSEQIETVFQAGCAGAFVFSWTDEWHRGGAEITDWDFGLLRRDGTAKPALEAVSRAMTTASSDFRVEWPRISVVVCSYNGQRYLDECLTALACLDYPNYEVIVVDDGSTDNTSLIASRHCVRLIQTNNRGLSAARNTGAQAASGVIVAYVDDDGYPDPSWLNRLAVTFLSTEFAAVGGPNLPVSGDPDTAACVAHAPGGPIHVLLSDTEAEHIPGCNMAFWKDALLAVGGFDPQFRTAGDDVDVCWKIQQRGWKVGFCPTATVFHHRRATLRAYWKQQVGYGKAEALLERKWPDKYNSAGHASWTGRIYDVRGTTPSWWCRSRIYHGAWGSAAYQQLYSMPRGAIADLLRMPEWYLILLVLSTLSLIGLLWKPLVGTVPLLIGAAAFPLSQSIIHAKRAADRVEGRSKWSTLFGISLVLHLLHPLGRLVGRCTFGLHPWRRRPSPGPLLPHTRVLSIWSERSNSAEQWLEQIRTGLREEGIIARSGDCYQNWDLEVEGGLFAGARTRIVVEEHGTGRQMLRFKVWPHFSRTGTVIAGSLLALAGAAAMYATLAPTVLLAALALLVIERVLHEGRFAVHSLTPSRFLKESVPVSTRSWFQAGGAADTKQEHRTAVVGGP
jgi:O-antigen biosynthesis protein